MNINEFYPTVSSDYFPTTDTTIEVTGDIRQQTDFETKFCYPYLIGAIESKNIPVCFRFPKVIFNTQEKTITAEYAKISDEYSDFMYSYPAYNFTSSKICMTARTLATGSYSMKCFNSLAPLQCYSNAYNRVINFSTISLDETENSNVYSYETSVSSTSAQQTINFLSGNGTINFAYRLSGDSADRTKSLSLNDFNNDGVHTFTLTENNVEHTIYIFIINVTNNFTYYYDANGISGNTNYIQNATQATIHYKIDDDSDDNDYVITFHPNGGESTIALLEVAHTGTGYNDSISNLGVVINGYSRLLHFELSNFVYGNLDSKIVYQNGKTFIAYWRSLTSFEDYYIIRGWTPKDVKFYLAMFSSLSDGTETGRYLPRIENNVLTGEFYNWFDVAILGTDWQISNNIRDNDYTESDKPTPTNTDIDDTEIRNEITNLPATGGIRFVSGHAFTSFYLLTETNVSELASMLSYAPSTFWNALGTATDDRMSNILNYIVSLKWYALDIHASEPTLYLDTQTNDIQFGYNANTKLSFITQGLSYLLGTVNRVYSFGTVDISTKFGQKTFLDTEPYTSVTANLPFIGKINLPANFTVGYTLHLYYVVDLVTGMCTAIIHNGYDTVYTGTGKIGVDIAVSGNDVITQSEKLSSAYINAGIATVNNSLGVTENAIAGNISESASGGIALLGNIANSAIAIANAKRGVPQTVGSGSGFGSTYAPDTPCITIERPAVKIPGDYGHSVGFLDCGTHNLGTLSGLTICENPDLSGIIADSAEITELYNLLTTGIFL